MLSIIIIGYWYFKWRQHSMFHSSSKLVWGIWPFNVGFASAFEYIRWLKGYQCCSWIRRKKKNGMKARISSILFVMLVVLLAVEFSMIVLLCICSVFFLLLSYLETIIIVTCLWSGIMMATNLLQILLTVNILLANYILNENILTLEYYVQYYLLPIKINCNGVMWNIIIGLIY